MRLHVLAALTALHLSAVTASQDEMIEDILKSLAAGVLFFENQYRDINLDGVVGYSILHAELREAVRVCEDTELADEPQMRAAALLAARLNVTMAQAVRALRLNEPKYFGDFEPLVDAGFWSVPCEWTVTDSSLVYKAFRATECYDEQLSDKCISLLLGTWNDNGTPCIVTKACRDMMTRFGCPHYSLSHQLLYFMIGKMRGCSKILQGDKREPRTNLTEQDYKNIFCSNMMKSNEEIVRNGFPGQTQDIFTENIMLCGMAGFSDFYKADWLRQLLLWQDPVEGCFGKDEELISQGLSRELLDSLRQRKRVKRRDKTLTDGCSSHMTGVAVSALGGYLNYFLSEQDLTKRPLP